ncbi:Heat shock 70 kDa protein 12B [Psilocybe cubensis]|uniref:Heat shock 70 kDa protein 12B n=1 Tax=Psilocybe cubensis TaxID=181762 RepID=A0ACB8GPE7_PSICU|nr:Heat shock 70 kDa protein 12B [Psilocybe cubensis]KAH9476914.1 Heat shock 70 kDa protein 12B [Psilocybe cubensis]
MSCCGEPKDANPPQNRALPQHTGGTIVNQPGYTPGLEKPQYFQQPSISPPPAIHANAFSVNGQQQQIIQQQQTGWGGSPSPPPMNDFAQMNGASTNTAVNGTYNGASFNVNNGFSASNAPLMRPGSAHNRNMSISTPPLPNSQSIVPAPDEGKMSISIDFGTTFSGVAFGSSRIAGGKVQQILQWPGSFETFRKIPTCLLYDEFGRVLAWGLEAKNTGQLPGVTRCEWFKLFLEPQALRDEGAIDPRLPAIPAGKKPLDLIVDFLSCLWEYAKDQITREIGAVADLNTADVWLTVPAAWDAKGCDIMREAAITAGLVQSSHAGDTNWRERLRIITEPEAAAVHCAQLNDLHHLKPSQNFIVCDAGGGTVDLAVYKIIGQMANLEIAEMCARSGANCGSLFLDFRFRELVKTLLADHPTHLDSPSLAYFMHSFSETEKLSYTGVQDDENMFHFTCFNVDDPHDPSVGLINGELSIPGILLRREVFDPVVNEVLQLIEDQIARVDQPIHALLLVGGFAGSEYLKQRVQEQFSNRIRVIARPPDADTATLRGAASYGLARRPLVSSVIAPRSYLMKVKLPAEQEDWLKRPAYIRNNDAGVPICENRLQYLVSKGAILRKGQRLTTKFCKFSQTVQGK